SLQAPIKAGPSSRTPAFRIAFIAPSSKDGDGHQLPSMKPQHRLQESFSSLLQFRNGWRDPPRSPSAIALQQLRASFLTRAPCRLEVCLPIVGEAGNARAVGAHHIDLVGAGTVAHEGNLRPVGGPSGATVGDA